MLHSITKYCFRHFKLVIGIWILAVVLTGYAASALGSNWLEQGTLKGTESTRALELLRAERPDLAADAGASTGRIVFRSDDAIINHKDEIDAYLTKLVADKKKTDITKAESPFAEMNVGQISRDGKIAYASVTFTESKDVMALGDPAEKAAKQLRKNIDVEFSGYAFQKFEFPASELIGMGAALIILLVAFGSLVAAGLPLVIAIFGVSIGGSFITLWGHAIGVPNFTTQVAAMISIGVGIDYALFIITRYREALKRGHNRETAVVEAMTTSGAAVLFAGITVVISLLGMIVINIDFIRGLAIGTSTSVLVMVIAALTLLPAVLGSPVGKWIDRLSLPHRKEVPDKPKFWVRWSEFIQRRAWFAAIAGAALLIVLAIPLLSLRVGVSDDGNISKKQTVRKAYDILAEGFGPGFNGPFFTVVDARDANDNFNMIELIKGLENTKGVAAVFPSSEQLTLAQGQQSGQESSAVSPIQIFATTSPQDAQTTELVHHLRDEVIPELTQGTGTHVLLSGLAAGNVDFADVMAEKVPYFIGAVLILSFLLLMAVFRSVLVALKAVIMNLLSIGASYGVIVAIFQWGWGKALFGIDTTGPIEPWAPMMLFAIVFGLSMDYEVFLLSKIKEEYDETKDNAGAVTHGLAATARVITAAALIMVCVFASFVLADGRVYKLMGLGLSVAVLLDVTIVRMLLVPATMELLGDRNWWMPKWLDKIVPQIHVEPVKSEVDAGVSQEDE